MSKRPIFSIIVPAFENTQYILQGLINLLDQTEGNIELIYGFEITQPDLEEILQEVSYGDPRLKILTTPKRRSLGAIYNNCLEHATGRYILFLLPCEVLYCYQLKAIARDLRKDPNKHHCYFIKRTAERHLQRTDHLYTHLKGIDTYGGSWSYIFHRKTIKEHHLQFPNNSNPNIQARYSARYTKAIKTKNIYYHNDPIECLFQDFEFPRSIGKAHVRNYKELIKRLQQAHANQKIPKNLDRHFKHLVLLMHLTAVNDFLLLSALEKAIKNCKNLSHD